jgi:hypothetical protein
MGNRTGGVRPLALGATHVPLNGRRLISVLAMLPGALTGGVLLRWADLAAPLWLARCTAGACATGAYLAASRPQSGGLAVAR